MGFAMENRLLAFTKLARSVSERILPERAHKFAPKTYTQPQLLTCLLVKEYLSLDYRTVQEMLELSDGLRQALGLERVPDYSTLWHFAHEKLSPEVIEAALAETVSLLQAEPTSRRGPSGGEPALYAIALDSTGLWTSHASRYFEWRSGRRRQRSWLKWSAALWTTPQLVVAQRVRPGPCGDFSELVPLASTAHGRLPFERLVADAGYDSEANHAFCRERLQVESLIPAKRRRSRTVVAHTTYRSLMVEALGEPGDPGCKRAYRQRWKAETLMSVLKRKWGGALTARREAMQRVQALLHGLVYNLYRLVVLDLHVTT